MKDKLWNNTLRETSLLSKIVNTTACEINPDNNNNGVRSRRLDLLSMAPLPSLLHDGRYFLMIDTFDEMLVKVLLSRNSDIA